MINATQDSSAEYYVLRAYCCSNRIRIIKAPGAGGSPDEVVALYDREFIRKCGLESIKKTDDEKIRVGLERINSKQVRARETWFVVFDRDAVELGVPDRLRDRYRGLTFLLLTGETWELANPPRLSRLLHISPHLEPGEEDLAYVTIGAMTAICGI